MSLRNIRLLLAYDGTDFNGWQVQAAGRTVQGEIEDVLFRMHKRKVNLTGAGRTDAGVHARGQVANFFTDINSMEPEDFTPALNSFLSKDIRVMESGAVPESFHSRYDAKLRTYRYYLLPDGRMYPWERRYCLPLFRRPDLSALAALADRFVGDHDFSAFCREDEERKSTRRRVQGSAFFWDGRFLVYQIAGNAFLWKMVRSVVGTILDFEKSGRPAEEIDLLLESGERRRAGVTAPPYPLFLHRIDYGD